jgi:FkbM family methyltransferase
MSSARDETEKWQLLMTDGETPEWLARLAPHVAGYSLKRRLILIDLLKAGSVVELDGGIRLSLHSEYELRRIKKSGESDKPIADWVRSFRPGEVFYDVGANTGLFSLMAGRLHGPAVPVYAFEPSYSSYEALVRNVVLNGLSASVHALPLALYSETSLKPLHYRSLEAGAAKHAVDTPFDTKTRTLFEPVASQAALAITLDDFVSRFGAPPPVHVKIDVDGHEEHVLAGAGAALATSVRTLCLEATQSDEADDRRQMLENRLVSCGFRLSQTICHHPDRYPRVFDLLFVRAQSA